MRSLPRCAIVLGAFATLVTASCSSERDEGTSLGVNDVRRACELRTAWAAPTSESCVQCQTAAILERCECEVLRDFSAACIDPANAVRREPTCTQEIEGCARACPKGDCACVEACYGAAAACKSAAAGRDGCVVDVCSPHCGAP